MRLLVSYFLVISTIWIATSSSLEENLMDTRTATSDIGWTMPQGSEWQEASSPHEDGVERRVLMVCRMQKVKQNNWVRSPFISVRGASRIYVEFEFTMRSCEDVPNVATCKETFNLYYYETDRDEATSTFPPWTEEEYIKVDTIAADKRFTRGSAETNLETRDIGPITKKGIYVALQDTGACMALMHVRVYYKYCGSVVQNLAQFPQTKAGPEKTSLVEVTGGCVEHSSQSNFSPSTSLHCNSAGDWAVPKGQCECDPGYTPSPQLATCQACGRGLFKLEVGNNPCERCPAYSHSRGYGSTACECMFGYFRATSDEPTLPCTKPPSKPLNLQLTANQSKTELTWDPPLSDGGRDDLFYRIECEKCDPGFDSCRPCSNLYYSPASRDLHVTKVKVQGLADFAHYKFKVFAENGVSPIASGYGSHVDYATVTMATDQAKPPKITSTEVVDVRTDSFTLTWVEPAPESNLEYQIFVSDQTNQPLVLNVSGKSYTTIYGLMEDMNYVILIRGRNEMGFGPFSDPLRVKTLGMFSSPPESRENNEEDNVVILVAVIVGVLLVMVAIVGICLWHRRTQKNVKEVDLDLEKLPMFNASTLLSTATYPSPRKTYIDPCTYDDPHRALLEFTKEIDAAYVKIESVIGGGEFGDVCRGAALLPDHDKPRDVAIKTLKSGHNSQQKLDFLGEASIMGQFDHPNVIRLEGVVTRSRPFMIITEYMENGSLDAFLRDHDNELTVIQLVGMLRNISEGMKYLSEMGYIHRDLAARNILVDSELICKVSDFGMSRVLEIEEDATYTTRGGKIPIRWTAPEAVTFRKFTSASDVWSYGIVMWEVTSYGERPYWGMSNQDVIQAVGSGYRLPAPMDCPLVLHHLMLSCWKKDRGQRPKFAEIVASLDRIIRDPAQLKLKAGVNSNNNGRLVPVEDRLLATPIDEKNLLSGSNSSVSDISSQIFSQNSQDFSILSSWLESIGLGSYVNTFVQCGCYTLGQVCQLKPNDLCRIGMTNPNDQNTLLDNIYAIRCEKEGYNSLQDDNLEGVPV